MIPEVRESSLSLGGVANRTVLLFKHRQTIVGAIIVISTNLEPTAAPSDTTSFSSLTRRQSFTHLVKIDENGHI